MRRTFRRILFGLLVAAALLPQQAFAAGTLVVTPRSIGNGIYRYTMVWTSDAAGAVSGNPMNIRPGRIIQMKFTPAGGGTQPTDLYDAVLNEINAVDLTIGGGANLSNVTSKILLPSPTYYYDGTTALDLVISNAGNAKSGTFTLWIGP